MEPTTDIVIDTVAFIRSLEDRLPSRARHVFEQAGAGRGALLFPDVALGEYVWSALSGKLHYADPKEMVAGVLAELQLGSPVRVSSMPQEAWGWLLKFDMWELHDAMIAAEALARGLPLISNDPKFKDVPGLKVIWD